MRVKLIEGVFYPLKISAAQKSENALCTLDYTRISTTGVFRRRLIGMFLRMPNSL